PSRRNILRAYEVSPRCARRRRRRGERGGRPARGGDRHGGGNVGAREARDRGGRDQSALGRAPPAASAAAIWEDIMARVTLEGIRKKYGALEVVKGIDLEIADKEFVVLVGPSGCGKSTTLRMIAGLEDITGGVLGIDDKKVNALPPRERDIAMVFQDYALYPHKS